jgi:hypothetical protein
MRYLFERRYHLVESLDIGAANTIDNGAFQC